MTRSDSTSQKMKIARQTVSVERSLMVAFCVCQSKAKVAHVRHEYALNFLMLVPVKQEKGKTWAATTRLTSFHFPIVINPQHAALCIMIRSCHSYRHDTVRLFALNAINLTLPWAQCHHTCKGVAHRVGVYAWPPAKKSEPVYQLYRAQQFSSRAQKQLPYLQRGESVAERDKE